MEENKNRYKVFWLSLEVIQELLSKKRKGVSWDNIFRELLDMKPAI